MKVDLATMVSHLFCLMMLVCCAGFSGPAMANREKILMETNRVNMLEVCLVEVRKQMNLEKYASLVYKQMASHFNNVNVARKGFAKLFNDQSNEESEHFEKFINYINLRSASVENFNITMPAKSKWSNALEAVKDAIGLEHHVTNEIYRIHQIADITCKDVHLVTFLEDNFIDEQIESIHKLSKLETLLSNIGPNDAYGEYLIDRDLFQGKLTLDQL